MAEARGRDRWSHTSAILSLIANVNRDPKKKPSVYKPSDFDPYSQSKVRNDSRVFDMGKMKAEFTGA